MTTEEKKWGPWREITYEYSPAWVRSEDNGNTETLVVPFVSSYLNRLEADRAALVEALESIRRRANDSAYPFQVFVLKYVERLLARLGSEQESVND